MRKLVIAALLVLTSIAAFLGEGCKKKDNNTSSSGDAVLSITTGARSIQPGSTVSYEAVVVDTKGNVTPATGVSWSVTNSLGSFSGNVFTPSNSGNGTITATATVNGKTLTAKVAIGVYLPAVFAVLPSAIMWTTDAGDIPLEPFYLGAGTVTGYSYSSSNSSVASVDANGNVSFHSAGECVITVTANGLSENNKVYVPVLVTGMPPVSLPIVRVAVNPTGKEMFRGETYTFTARAFNSANAEVSGTTFTWSSDNASVASVDGTGKVTATSIGKAIITATASGIVGQAEVEVLPDSLIIVTPIMASIPAGGTKQFTAQAYRVNHSNLALTAISMPAGLTWEVPTTGVPIFDIATVNSTGLVTMNTSASVGLASMVVAHVTSPTIDPGVALIMVSDCDCGTTTPGVDHINLPGGNTMNASITGGPVTVNAVAVDAANNPVSGATIHLCSDNITVCNVDNSTGEIIPTSPGTAVITVCNGGVSTTITVTVTF